MIPDPHQPHLETTPPGTGEGVDKGEGRPDWLPDRFETPEALAKSYAESQAEMNRLRAERDEERLQWTAALEQISAQQNTPAQPGLDPQTNALLASYQQAVESGDAAAQLAITLGLQKQMMDQTIEERFKQVNPVLEGQAQAQRDASFQIAQDRVARQVGDRWTEIAPEVNTWLHEHAAWLPQQASPDAFEQVIREGVSAIEGKKAADELAQLRQARDARLSAQTATGGATARYPIATDEKAKEWDAVKGAANDSYSNIARS